ncbi:hypothetical protein LZC95_06795 [Pendulispora brunnea]|uniref:Uncharacterized protein n=1 Tax=Pendulispora brunnea TaxID=2905690 RepID=A0ABZ2KNV5_9BACT
MRRVGIVFGVSVFVACGGSSSDPGTGGGGREPRPVIEGCPVAPPAEAEWGISDKCGLFVSSSKGTATGDGSSVFPFASLQKAIDAAKVNGKRVYACAQSYREQITLAEDVEIYGYFDCSAPTWKTGPAKAVIDGPSSPAVKATGIHNARVDGFEIRSPDATTPSGSSIAVVAISSPGVKIYNSKIRAGAGAKGADGVEGLQLVPDAGLNGSPPLFEVSCKEGACSANRIGPLGGHMGFCSGRSEYPIQPGGWGGIGGIYTADSAGRWVENAPPEPGAPQGPVAQYDVALGAGVNGSPPPAIARSGATGVDGRSGDGIGGFSEIGEYVPSNGLKGTDGRPGQGGGGGGAHAPFRQAREENEQLVTSTGGGGGAGGCPGVAGTPGGGGGASVALVAVQSPIQIFASTIETVGGGGGGKGTNGSAPTPGGEAGGLPNYPSLSGAHGGAGGRAGVSGSGGGGPSIGIAFKAGAPILTTTDARPGPGGAGVPELRVDGRGTVPASAQGVSVPTREF